MNIIIIHFLLFSCILIVINGNVRIKQKILDYFRENNESNVTGSEQHKLELVKMKELGRTAHSVVWKGIYNDKKDVAVKIFMNEVLMNNEIKVYMALNAIDDEEIERRHIPKVYYYGKLRGSNLYAIAMSLFDGTLADYYNNPRGKSLSHLDIIYTFMQAVEALEYLTKMNVVHNDIKPRNLFYRGEDIFLGDFDMAAVNGAQNKGHTLLFASRNFFANKSRSAMDDLESLVYSISFLAGVPLEPGKNHEPFPDVMPEGYVLCENLKRGRKFARSRIMKKFNKYLSHEHVRDVFESLLDEILSDKKIPNYENIFQTLQDAIIGINLDRGSVKSQWLPDSLCSTLGKIMGTILCEV